MNQIKATKEAASHDFAPIPFIFSRMKNLNIGGQCEHWTLQNFMNFFIKIGHDFQMTVKKQ